MVAPCHCKSFRQNSRTTGAWAGLIFFLFSFLQSFAQNSISFEAAINVKEVIVGVPFELTFTLKNAEGSRFTAPTFTGFKTGGISEMRGMSFENRRSTTSQTWSVELTPTKPGVYSIGPATVYVNGRTLNSKALTISVVSLASSSKGNVNLPPGSDDKIFVAAEFDRKEAFVGQQLTWRIRLYTQVSVEGYDIISLPDFAGFYTKEKIRYDKRVEYLTIRRKKYAVRTLHEEALFAQESGELSIGPARVSVGIEQPGAQGFLFGPKPVTLQTQAITLNVKTLPQPLPESFTGGVGQYEWSVQADTNALSTDDALTLVLELKGNGDSRRFAPPKIQVPANCEIFEPRILEEEEYEGEFEILHRKRYEYVVLPKDTGNMEIRPLLSYFDVDSNRYSQLDASPIRFSVSIGKNYQSPNAPTIQDPAPADQVGTEPDFMARLMDWLRSPLLWSIVALPFVVLGFILLFKKRKPSPTAPAPRISVIPPQAPAPPPMSADLASARMRFANVGLLLKNGDPARFYAELFRAMQALISVRLGLQPSQMNDLDVSALLLKRGVTPIRTQALLSIWHTCEQAIYGAQAQAEHMEPTWQLATQVMEALERELR